MPIEELKEPIWEKQKGETPNQHCYFLEFLEFPTFNLKEFHNHLCEERKKTQTDTKVVTYDTLRRWAGENCNKWHIRKQAKRKSEKDDILETLHEIDKRDAIDNFITKKQIKKELLAKISIAIDLDVPLSQINQGVQALKTLHEDDLLDKEEPTEFTKADITADIDAKTESKIAMDFDSAYNELINDTRKDSLHLKDSD